MRPRCNVAEGTDRERYWRELGQFIQTYAPWTWWATLTFQTDISEVAGELAFRDWARSVAREIVRDHVPIAWASELQRRGIPAYHALLAVPEGRQGFSASVGHRCWRRAHRSAGHTRIERYDPQRGAAYYAAAHSDWDLNVACPRAAVCRHRNGCLYAPGPW